jgi:hypothetical protein
MGTTRADKRFLPRRSALHISLLVLTLAVALVPAGAQDLLQDPAFWTHLKPGTTLPRCAESSIAFKDARARLTRFDPMRPSAADSLRHKAWSGGRALPMTLLRTL